MIDLDQVKALSKIESDKEDIVTLYLNTNNKEFTSKEKIAIRLKDQTAKLRELGFEDDAKLIEERFDLIKLDGTKLVVIISSKANDLFEVLTFNVPMKTQVHVKNKVYIPPLLRILDEYERYALVLVDKKQMRLFTIYMGEIEENEESSQEFPGHHAQGGWSQARFQRHVEEHAKKMMKQASEEVFKVSKKKPFDRLIVGGSKEIISEFENMLHSELKPKVAGSFVGEMFLSNDEVLKRSLEIEEKIEREKEAELIEKLENNLGYDNRAVRGLDKVVRNFEEGKVMQLLIDSEYSAPGKRCQKCGHLSIDEMKCEFCGGDVDFINDIVAELVAEAINKGVVVEYVRNSKSMKKNKNIGAFLRF
ncbi:hypothetical protein KKC60_03580 [Patescibacteria group bacterium]|nr:hypothetical protein [Patescibacteria group bacterium]